MRNLVSARRAYRLLEILPGFLVWTTFAVAVAACYLWPVGAIGFVLVFDVYWLVRIVYIMFFVILSYRRYRRTLTVDWRAQLNTAKPRPTLWHLIVIPTVSEPEEVLRGTFQALQRAVYDPARTIVVLTTEARSKLQGTGIYERLVNDFASSFGALIFSIHPDRLPGEVIGKGANITWGGRMAKKWIDEHQIPYADIIVTTIDCDSVLHPQYLAYLAITYLSNPRPTKSSYQPIPLFHNNIWETLPWMRVVSYSTTFWLMSETERPDRMFTFSSHSMPFQALVDVDFWQTDVVSEDSRIFLQCLIRYDGDYTVRPMYLPISMDAIQAPTWWESMKNQYKQIRRWAYGAENFPYMIWNFLSNSRMGIRTRLRYLFYQIEGMYSWAVAPVLILLLGWLPFRIRPDLLDGSVLAQNAPTVLRWIMLAAMIGAVVSALLSILMLPKRPQNWRWTNWIFMGLQWLLLPITMIVFGSIPAIEAQSRLMLGRYLGFWVTDKHRTK